HLRVKGAVAVAAKQFKDRGFFLVIARDSSDVQLFDDATGELVKTITIAPGEPLSLGPARSVDVPWVYYGLKASPDFGRLDVSKLVDQSAVGVNPTEGSMVSVVS